MANQVNDHLTKKEKLSVPFGKVYGRISPVSYRPEKTRGVVRSLFGYPDLEFFSIRGRGATATADSARAEEALIAQESSGKLALNGARQQTETVSNNNT